MPSFLDQLRDPSFWAGAGPAVLDASQYGQNPILAGILGGQHSYGQEQLRLEEEQRLEEELRRREEKERQARVIQGLQLMSRGIGGPTVSSALGGDPAFDLYSNALAAEAAAKEAGKQEVETEKERLLETALITMTDPQRASAEAAMALGQDNVVARMITEALAPPEPEDTIKFQQGPDRSTFNPATGVFTGGTPPKPPPDDDAKLRKQAADLAVKSQGEFADDDPTATMALAEQFYQYLKSGAADAAQIDPEIQARVVKLLAAGTDPQVIRAELVSKGESPAVVDAMLASILGG